SAVTTRCLSILTSGHAGLGHLLTGQTKPTLTLLECRRRCMQLGTIEVRPQLIAEIELSIRSLPQQKVTDANLPAGTYQQIQLRQIRHRDIAVQKSFSNVFSVQPAGDSIFGNTLGSLGIIPASAVVGCVDQGLLANPGHFFIGLTSF